MRGGRRVIIELVVAASRPIRRGSFVASSFRLQLPLLRTRVLQRTVSFLDGEAVTPSSKRSNVKIYRSPEVKYRPRQKKVTFLFIEDFF